MSSDSFQCLIIHLQPDSLGTRVGMMGPPATLPDFMPVSSIHVELGSESPFTSSRGAFQSG